MAGSESESDNFSDIFDSTPDLALVIGHLDRKLRISEEGPDAEERDNASHTNKSQTQPQSIASDLTAGLYLAQQQPQINKGVFPNRSLSSSASSINDEDPHHRHPGPLGRVETSENGVEVGEGTSDGGRSACVLQRASMEIIDSESSYVMDLQQVIEGYLHDWKERACLKLDELDTLFMNIEQLYAVNSQLNDRLSRFRGTEGNVEQIAKCFLELREEFIVYTTYCTRYPDAIALLTRLLQSTHTNSLLTSTQKVLNHTLPLGSYLLKPVQRILKYHLLLDNLRKHCNVPEVEKAHQQMLKVARDIDQVKKALEQKGRVRQLCGILDGWLGPELTVLGELRHEGVLSNNNKAREVFLFDTMLIITKAKEDRRLQFKSYIHRKDIMLVEQIPGEPCSFFVIPYSDPKNQIKFVAQHRNQKKLWAHHIKAVMLEDLNIPNRAKDLVFQLGDEDDIPCDKSLKKWGNTSSTPDYLERRHRYRRSEIKERSKTKAAAKLEQEKAAAAAAATPTKDPFEPCCADGKECNCAIVKNQLKEDIARKLDASELVTSVDRQAATPINRYTTNAMPKRIMNLKKTRSKTMPSSIFYASLATTDNDNDLNDNGSSKGSVHGGEDSVTDSREQLVPDQEEETLSRVSTSSEASAGDRVGRSSVGASGSRSVKKSSAFRASDSHLHYNKVAVMAAKRSNSEVASLVRSNTISSSSSNNAAIEKKTSGGGKVKKNNSSLYKSWRSVKEEQESTYSSFQHLPGSSNLGERIANVDYVDPQTLFCVKHSASSSSSQHHHRKSEIILSTSMQQRDSVVSFTSSSDSVEEVTKGESLIYDRIGGGDSYYEDDIERCLEDASLFRDSAIYSDDNDQRRTTTTKAARKSSAPASSSSRSSGQEPSPPPVPYKPKHVTELQQKKLQELTNKKLERQLSGGKSGVPVSPATAALETEDAESSAAVLQNNSFLFKVTKLVRRSN